MSIRIRLASSASELDRLYVARHRAMSSTRPSSKNAQTTGLFDQCDTYPDTANIIATREQQIVGGVRISRQADAMVWEDPSQHTAMPFQPEIQMGHLSMFFLSHAQAAGSFLGHSILGLGFQWAISQGLTHLSTVLTERFSQLLLDAGFKPIWSDDGDGPIPVKGAPAILDLTQLDERFLRFNQREGTNQFMFGLERDYYEAGEVIVAQGEQGSSCYLIGTGEVAVEVIPPGQTQLYRIAELGPGQFFGELALLTSRPRSASVVAIHDVELMVISRQAFNNLVRTNSTIAVRLLELLGERLASTVERLAVATVTSQNLLLESRNSNAWLGGDGCSWG